MNRRTMLQGAAALTAAAIAPPVFAAVPAIAPVDKLAEVTRAWSFLESLGFDLETKVRLFGLEPKYIKSLITVRDFAAQGLSRDFPVRVRYLNVIEDEVVKRAGGRDANANRRVLLELNPISSHNALAMMEIGSYADLLYVVSALGYVDLTRPQVLLARS